VRLLPDTHVLIWWMTGDPELSSDIKAMLDGESEVYLSAAVVWELAIKQAARKLFSRVELAERVRDFGFRDLPITAAHAAEAGRLPLIHRDPFDRVLVAQARCEQLTLVSHDRAIQKYDVSVISSR
jgi:PIN domain nuclease of toxin-antitoxin system